MKDEATKSHYLIMNAPERKKYKKNKIMVYNVVISTFLYGCKT